MAEVSEFERQTLRFRDSSGERRRRIVGLLHDLHLVVRPLPRSLVGTVDAVVMSLAGATSLPQRRVATTVQRAEAIEDMFRAALAPIGPSWVDDLLDTITCVVQAEEFTSMIETAELTRRVVRAAVDASSEEVTNLDYRAAVRWADAAGYLTGSWDAEFVAYWDAHGLADDNLSDAVVHLERAIFHRAVRFEVCDTMLAQLRLQAAAWRAELGDHDAALIHFQLAHPAVDAVSDPLDPGTISAFRAAAESAGLLDRLDLAVQYQGQVVGRLQRAYERAQAEGASSYDLCERRRAMVGDQLDLVRLHLQRHEPQRALAVLDELIVLPRASLRPGSRGHTVAQAFRAEAMHRLGHRSEAQVIARHALPQARRHFGQHDPLVLALEDLGGSDA